MRNGQPTVSLSLSLSLEHVDKLCSKVNRSISGLKQARVYVPLDVLNTIYKSLIQPVFDYCDVVWDNLDQGLATRIQKLQNHAARIMLPFKVMTFVQHKYEDN